METYLINSAGCLAILLLFYKLLLEKESMHLFKRYYLLGSVLIAFIIPLITFTTYVEVYPNNFGDLAENSIVISENSPVSTVNWSASLWGIYVIGVLIFSIKFLMNLFHLFRRIQQNPKLKNNNYIHVLLRDRLAPHTFFNYLFFNKEAFVAKQIPSEVIVHEEAHANQLHSLDILFMEVLQIMFWFNPLIYLAKNAIKLNHEFLADREVINKGIQTSSYQETLLAFSSNAQSSKLANAFNYSSIKKRFTVMKTNTSKRTIWSKGLLLLPLLAILLFSFSTTEVVERDASFSNSENLKSPHYKNSLIQEIATKKMVKEYNALAKKYNETAPGELMVMRKELDRMRYIYELMSPEQRGKSEKFPMRLPPPAPDAPKAPMAPKAEREMRERVPPAPQVEIEIFEMDGDSEVIPPPPPPVPSEHMQELADEGAEFYLEGKKITPEEAINLVKSKKLLTIDVRKMHDESTVVKITTEPIKKN